MKTCNCKCDGSCQSNNLQPAIDTVAGGAELESTTRPKAAEPVTTPAVEGTSDDLID